MTDDMTDDLLPCEHGVSGPMHSDSIDDEYTISEFFIFIMSIISSSCSGRGASEGSRIGPKCCA